MGIVHNRLALRIYSGGFGTQSEYFPQNINKSLQVFLFRTILVLIIQGEPLFYFCLHTITFLENTLHSVRHCPLNKPKKKEETTFFTCCCLKSSMVMPAMNMGMELFCPRWRSINSDNSCENSLSINWMPA